MVHRGRDDGVGCRRQPPAGRIPVIYSTDLLHPHDDPDDHYDLATLFALPELDVRGIVLDLGERQQQRMGRPPVEQILHLAGRRVPYVMGINRPLSIATTERPMCRRSFKADRADPSTLRESKEKVVLFSRAACGTWRRPSIANRICCEPRCGRLFNAGNGPGGVQNEWNVKLDPEAYQRVFESGLPLYWYPCFGQEATDLFCGRSTNRR